MKIKEKAKGLELTVIPSYIFRNLPQRRVVLAKHSGSKDDNGKKRSENRHD